MKVDKQAIRELAELLIETGLTEIEVEDDGSKVRVSRNAGPVAAQYALAPNFPMGDPGTPQRASMDIPSTAATDRAGAVKSPMVGTAYLSPEPGAGAFAPVGKAVKAGDTLLIIEAMKVMNPIKADKAGVVKEVFVTDGQPVEFGDALVVIG